MSKSREAGKVIGSESTSSFKMSKEPRNDSDARKVGVIRVEIGEMLNNVSVLENNFLKDKNGNNVYIILCNEKWIYCDNLKCRQSWGYPGHACAWTVKANIHGSNIILCI